ncbi:MAG TPA: hypothetical protein [Bacteriophage sp.]|nr:MAG TPA: hypothetical protein [Bacteriophage sp.]
MRGQATETAVILPPQETTENHNYCTEYQQRKVWLTVA